MTTTYQQCKDSFENVSATCVKRSDGWFIPLTDPDNTDYAKFKKDLSEGASLKDAEGNDMTAEQITAFLGTLP